MTDKYRVFTECSDCYYWDVYTTEKLNDKKEYRNAHSIYIKKMCVKCRKIQALRIKKKQFLVLMPEKYKVFTKCIICSSKSIFTLKNQTNKIEPYVLGSIFVNKMCDKCSGLRVLKIYKKLEVPLK